MWDERENSLRGGGVDFDGKLNLCAIVTQRCVTLQCGKSYKWLEIKVDDKKLLILIEGKN